MTVALKEASVTAERKRLSDYPWASRAAALRWEAHVRRVQANPFLSEAMKRYFTDDEVWSNADIAEEMGFAPSRARIMRTPLQRKRRPRPHPAMLPDEDVEMKKVADRVTPGVAAGRLRCFAANRGTHVVDPDTGDLVVGMWTLDEDTGDMVIRPRRQGDGVEDD